MDIKITDKKDEALLSRTKIKCEMNFEAATPSEKEVKKQIASLLKADESLIAIKSIYTTFGLKKANVTAYVYTDKKEMEAIELKPKGGEEKKEGEKKEEKAEQAKEAPKEKAEEKPKEEAKQEEKPKEEKKE